MVWKCGYLTKHVDFVITKWACLESPHHSASPVMATTSKQVGFMDVQPPKWWRISKKQTKTSQDTVKMVASNGGIKDLKPSIAIPKSWTLRNFTPGYPRSTATKPPWESDEYILSCSPAAIFSSEASFQKPTNLIVASSICSLWGNTAENMFFNWDMVI